MLLATRCVAACSGVMSATSTRLMCARLILVVDNSSYGKRNQPSQPNDARNAESHFPPFLVLLPSNSTLSGLFSALVSILNALVKCTYGHAERRRELSQHKRIRLRLPSFDPRQRGLGEPDSSSEFSLSKTVTLAKA